MAICYECRNQFYGEICEHCGWIVQYKCWKCKTQIIPEYNEQCKNCGWYICNFSESCGCQEDRPLSNEEKEEYNHEKHPGERLE